MNFPWHHDAAPIPEDLSSDLHAAYAIPVPDLAFDLRAASGATLPLPAHQRFTLRRVAFATGGVVAAAAALLLTPVIFGGGAKAVSAEQIINRAQQAAFSNVTSNGKPYHLVATTDVFQKGFASRTETWSLDPAHTRTEETVDSNGIFGTSQDGTDFWLYTNAPAGLRVVHVANVPPGSLSPGSGVPSFADFLSQETIKDCHFRSLEGTQTVAGREAYVVRLDPDASNCPDSMREQFVAQGGATQGSTRIWIDAETSIALRMEQVASDGTRGYHYEVSKFEVGAAIDPSVFTYRPPAGATVIEMPNAVYAIRVLAVLTGGEDLSFKSGPPPPPNTKTPTPDANAKP